MAVEMRVPQRVRKPPAPADVLQRALGRPLAVAGGYGKVPRIRPIPPMDPKWSPSGPKSCHKSQRVMAVSQNLLDLTPRVSVLYLGILKPISVQHFSL